LRRRRARVSPSRRASMCTTRAAPCGAPLAGTPRVSTTRIVQARSVACAVAAWFAVAAEPERRLYQVAVASRYAALASGGRVPGHWVPAVRATIFERKPVPSRAALGHTQALQLKRAQQAPHVRHGPPTARDPQLAERVPRSKRSGRIVPGPRGQGVRVFGFDHGASEPTKLAPSAARERAAFAAPLGARARVDVRQRALPVHGSASSSRVATHTA
jgi:hypothetical protein